MYEQFYGLARAPFAVTPDPQMLFMSRVHREALATIIYGVETRKGFLVCTGEVGTGKSTIIRAFFDQAAADALKLIYIFTPQVTPFEMARFICRELDLADPESIFAAVPVLQLKLLEIFESGRTVVLMIDEAQLLPPETLEFLRLLSNFETDTEKLIQIVLVGQPEVDTMLARREMRQVNQRVALRARLGPFGVEESFDYIDHRLRVAGAGELTQVMSQSAAWLIAEAGTGIPRRINILADNALIAGFGAAQRPLGSRLAGLAVHGYLDRSGAAAAPPATPFAAGRRAARRLRSALLREKSEPAEFVAAAPATATSITTPTATPTATAGEVRPGAGDHQPLLIRPAPPGLLAAPAPQRPPPTRPVPPTPPSTRATFAGGAATALSPVPLTPVVSPAAEPVVQWVAFAEAEPAWIGYEEPLPAAAPPPANGAAPPPPRPPAALRPSRAVARPQWPALSRIRAGLEASPARAPNDLLMRHA